MNQSAWLLQSRAESSAVPRLCQPACRRERKAHRSAAHSLGQRGVKLPAGGARAARVGQGWRTPAVSFASPRLAGAQPRPLCPLPGGERARWSTRQSAPFPSLQCREGWVWSLAESSAESSPRAEGTQRRTARQPRHLALSRAATLQGAGSGLCLLFYAKCRLAPSLLGSQLLRAIVTHDT